MNILILSRQPQIYSTRRLVQEAEAAGHAVRVEDPEAALSESKIDLLIPRLGSFRYEAARDQLERRQKLYPPQRVLNGMPFFHQARHKMQALKILADLPQPELFSQVRQFPVVVKDCLASQGEGVFLCRTPHELDTCLLRLQGRELLFQEFIAESQGRDLRLFVIGQRVVAAMERISADPEREFRSNLSLGGHARPHAPRPEEITLSLQAVQRLGLDYAGVDLIRSHRGPLLLEVNPCPGLEGIEKWSQMNIAKEIIQYAESFFSSHS